MNNPTAKALIIGKDSIARAVQTELQARGVESEMVDDCNQKLDYIPNFVFNLWYPDPHSMDLSRLWIYPQELLEQGMSLGASMAQEHDSAAIINFAFLPAIYIDTPLESSVSSLRGSITGVTRTLARRFGKQGLRVTGVQAGLIDIPETQGWVSEKVKSVPVPSKRWANAEEVAKLLIFLASDSMYITGQSVIIDGGLTAGISGT